MKDKIIGFFKGPHFKRMLLIWIGIMLSPLCMVGMVLGRINGALERFIILSVIGGLLGFANILTAQFINVTLGHIEGLGTHIDHVIIFTIAEVVALLLGCISVSVARRIPGSIQLVGWGVQKSTLVYACAAVMSAGVYFGLDAQGGDAFAKAFRAASVIKDADEETQQEIRNRLAPYTLMNETMSSEGTQVEGEQP